jgi:phage terminase large subunit-like protein
VSIENSTHSPNASRAEWLASLPQPERTALLQSLSDEDLEQLEYDWSFWARRNQLAPAGTWTVWLILAGRGWGKTKTGAEWVRDLMCGTSPLTGGRVRHLALVGETAADTRKVMVGDGLGPGEGSGILQVHPKDFRPVYNPSLKRLIWPNGAVASLYNATEPDELRGPQHGAAWCDELAKWRYLQDTWDNLEFGLRIGDNPQVCITTTPKPIKALKIIIADPGTVKTVGTTYENIGNLAPKFIARVVSKYEGTRLGRQELRAEVLDDVPGALWSRTRIEDLRVKPAQVPQLIRIVVAIDPSASSGEESDEAGVVAAGKGVDGHAYILEDGSAIMPPASSDPANPGWANQAIAIFKARKADRIVAEVNNGGEMVEATIRMIDANVPYKAVHASRGKAIRAEPISALYEQGLVHHVGMFAVLEDQLCAFTSDFDRKTAGYSPDRLDALVWALTELMVDQPDGYGLLEHYRRMAEATKAGTAATKAATGAATVKMRAPIGASNVYGMSGRQYIVGADRIVEVEEADAKPLTGQGFERVAVAET